MPLLPPSENLTTEELNCLDTFLKYQHDEAKPLNFTQVHGFFTAFLSSPKATQHGQWQPGLFRGTPDYNEEEQEIDIMILLGRLNHQILNELNTKEVFSPLLLQDKKLIPYDQASLDLIGMWCEGYMYGTDLEIASPLEAGLLRLILPIWTLAFPRLADSKMKQEMKKIFDKELYKECREILPRQIKLIYEQCLHLRTSQSDYLAEESLAPIDSFSPDNPFSNTPCPCGSTLPYKSCCLLFQRLHH